jgi:hypothetical protein
MNTQNCNLCSASHMANIYPLTCYCQCHSTGQIISVNEVHLCYEDRARLDRIEMELANLRREIKEKNNKESQ